MIAIILPYYRPIRRDDLTLSIDGVILDLLMSDPVAREQLMRLLDDLPIKYTADVVHWTGTRPGTFREQFSIKLPGNCSFWLGVGLNGTKTDWARIRLDFNPNKVASNAVFKVVLDFLLEHTRAVKRWISRFDLAIDIPVERQNCFLIKDRRLYIERRHGTEFTQYLGAKSSTVGRVKLYNKQAESGLDFPLTRLELTLDPAKEFCEINMPTVFVLDESQPNFEQVRVTDTERFILNALLHGFGSVNDLGRKTRAKVEGLLKEYVKTIELLPEDYDSILSQLQYYVGEMA